MSAYVLSVFFSTFVLEDVALATAIGLIAEGKMSFLEGFFACFAGITVGDLALYFFGYLASRSQVENYLPFLKKHRRSFKRLKHSDFLTWSIVVSRMIPGTRLPTYLGAGYLGYSFLQFFVLTAVSVFGWVLAALLAGRSLHAIFMDHWVPVVAIFLFGLQMLKVVIPPLLEHWDRKAFFQRWRQWTHFEFWPAWFFYLPLVPYYIYLSLKHGSFLLPFYASPGLNHGGLIGESKWDFLLHLSPKDPSTLPTLKISKEADLEEAAKALETAQIDYPFILKPDVGQRGYGVRIIRDEYDLTEYLLLSDFEKIVQKRSELPMEAGLFYIRMPLDARGEIFSVTDKKFPFVVGDGKTKLGDLILKDPRAKIIAPVYFNRHREILDTVIEDQKPYFISECGNHCQGAIFLNGKYFITEALTEKLDQVAKQIPNFYFGRFDVRYLDVDSLKRGEFEIVEVNGAGAEATHIWDPKTTLFEAYRVLFLQWSKLFQVGAQVKALPQFETRVNIPLFLKDCAKVFFRKGNLAVSS